MVTQTVAEFVAGSTWEDLPQDVRHAAKRSLLNFFATALEGTHDSAVETALETLREFAGKGEVTLIGRAERADALTAAFINAAAANVHDFDDTHLRTVIHPTAPVAPALLALAECRPMSGKDLLHALALGIEFTCRIGNAVSPGHYARGWHITATCGVFGAALAVGKCLGQTDRQLTWSMGSASAQASGLVETLGFMAKSVGVGGSARGGLLAGLLGEKNYDGPDQPLEGVRGFLRVTGDDPNYDDVTGGLGSRWETLKNIHKPYPCGIVINAVIDGCLALHERLSVPVGQISSITLTGHPLLQQRGDRPNVTTGRESQVSAQHAVAVSLLYGKAGLAEFTDDVVQDPRVQAVRQRVKLAVNPDTPVPDVKIDVTYANGETEVIDVKDARGTDNRPLTDIEIEEKVRSLATQYAPDCGHVDQLIDAVWSLEDFENASDILAFAIP